jgi:hypothetical protein
VPPEPFAAPLCRTNACYNALPDQFALELGEAANKCSSRRAAGFDSSGIDVLRYGDKSDAERGQFLDAAYAVRHAPANSTRPVDLVLTCVLLPAGLSAV